MTPALERTARGFDRLSPHYDTLVRTLGGNAIPRSQTLFLDRVGDCRGALIVGGGTGQFLAALLESGFAGQVVNLDISRGMLRRTGQRVGPAALTRVELRQGDVGALADDERFDLVCTHCFLDLFTPPQLAAVAARLDAALEPGGLWLCSDFVDPAPTGSLRAAGQRTLLRALYGFFGWTCGVEPRRLPPIQATLAGHGLVPLGVREAAAGLLWSGCFRKPVAGSYNHRT